MSFLACVAVFVLAAAACACLMVSGLFLHRALTPGGRASDRFRDVVFALNGVLWGWHIACAASLAWTHLP